MEKRVPSMVVDDDDKAGGSPPKRRPYEPPRVLKKRSVARVTLFSGSGASGASGLTSS